MPFQLSPGTEINEFDLTTTVPSVGSSTGALAGVFTWGPVEEATFVSSEEDLVNRFGTPNSDNFETFFTAANFLSYTGSLFVSRAASNTAFNAVANTGPVSNTVVRNLGHYQTQTFPANTVFVAKYPGDLGNTLKISVCASANAYSMNVAPTSAVNTYTISYVSGSNTATISIVGANTTAANTAINEVVALLGVGDFVQAGNTTVGTQMLKISSVGSVAVSGNTANVTLNFVSPFTLPSNVSATTLPRFWEYSNVIDSAPGTSPFVAQRGGSRDEIHVVVEDRLGRITGVPGSILETFPFLSRATDAKSEQGASSYYVNVINNVSKWVWFANHAPSVTVGLSSAMTGLATNRPWTGVFGQGSSGASESTIPLQNLATAYNVYNAADEIDVSLIMTGKSVGGTRGEGVYNHIIDNIVSNRRDCMAFVSPSMSDVVNVPGREIENILAFRAQLRPSSYGVIDSGYKMQYDRYNDMYRWVPLNGDIAGLCARTDFTNDPWHSPAGANRGIIKNIVKLAYNPADKGSRDLLYKNSVNPVVSFKTEGTMLYGDKTLIGRPSAFDRINVRRLFIVLQKSISRASRYSLFELNDQYTRAQFRNLVEPYLRDVQGRRGITDFRVVCDETNNTPEVIDRNEFIGDIFIKPARSINFIQLNFIAVRTGVEFSEIVR